MSNCLVCDWGIVWEGVSRKKFLLWLVLASQTPELCLQDAREKNKAVMDNTVKHRGMKDDHLFEQLQVVWCDQSTGCTRCGG